MHEGYKNVKVHYGEGGPADKLAEEQDALNESELNQKLKEDRLSVLLSKGLVNSAEQIISKDTEFFKEKCNNLLTLLNTCVTSVSTTTRDKLHCAVCRCAFKDLYYKSPTSVVSTLFYAFLRHAAVVVAPEHNVCSECTVTAATWYVKEAYSHKDQLFGYLAELETSSIKVGGSSAPALAVALTPAPPIVVPTPFPTIATIITAASAPVSAGVPNPLPTITAALSTAAPAPAPNPNPNPVRDNGNIFEIVLWALGCNFIVMAEDAVNIKGSISSEVDNYTRWANEWRRIRVFLEDKRKQGFLLDVHVKVSGNVYLGSAEKENWRNGVLVFEGKGPLIYTYSLDKLMTKTQQKICTLSTINRLSFSAFHIHDEVRDFLKLSRRDKNDEKNRILQIVPTSSDNKTSVDLLSYTNSIKALLYSAYCVQMNVFKPVSDQKGKTIAGKQELLRMKPNELVDRVFNNSNEEEVVALRTFLQEIRYSLEEANDDKRNVDVILWALTSILFSTTSSCYTEARHIPGKFVLAEFQRHANVRERFNLGYSLGLMPSYHDFCADTELLNKHNPVPYDLAKWSGVKPILEQAKKYLGLITGDDSITGVLIPEKWYPIEILVLLIDNVNRVVVSAFEQSSGKEDLVGTVLFKTCFHVKVIKLYK